MTTMVEGRGCNHPMVASIGRSSEEGMVEFMAEKGAKDATIIKKYANRRLYHTGTICARSSSVT